MVCSPAAALTVDHDRMLHAREVTPEIYDVEVGLADLPETTAAGGWLEATTGTADVVACRALDLLKDS